MTQSVVIRVGEYVAKILVVDDSPDVLLLCRVHLEYEGYTVETAEDGMQALERIALHPPDLVILDIMMPQMDGWDVLAAIRENEVTARIPVIMLTARGEGLDEIRGWREGASGYVTKPFNPKALSQTVSNALRRSPSETDLIRTEMLDKLEFDRRLSAESHHETEAPAQS